MTVNTPTLACKARRGRRARCRDSAPALLPRCRACGGELFFSLPTPAAAVEVLCADCTAFTVARDLPPDPARDVSDLPPVLRLGKPNDQLVYRILRDLGRCRPADVREEFARRGDPFIGRTTICHALARLRDAGLLAHTSAGWTLCGPRGRKGGA